jgi:hypothetical protein
VLDDGGHRSQLAGGTVALRFPGDRFRFPRTEVAVVVRSDLRAHDIDLVAGIYLFA